MLSEMFGSWGRGEGRSYAWSAGRVLHLGFDGISCIDLQQCLDRRHLFKNDTKSSPNVTLQWKTRDAVLSLPNYNSNPARIRTQTNPHRLRTFQNTWEDTSKFSVEERFSVGIYSSPVLNCMGNWKENRSGAPLVHSFYKRTESQWKQQQKSCSWMFTVASYGCYWHIYYELTGGILSASQNYLRICSFAPEMPPWKLGFFFS